MYSFLNDAFNDDVIGYGCNIYELGDRVAEYIENSDYRGERGSLCTATPASITRNRTPPPPSQKHHFAQKHQINFCNDEIHCPLCGRGRADDY